MTRLSVNINKIATIRNARGGSIPDIVYAAVQCQKFGAHGITLHPRPDERHIRYQDVFDIKPVITTEINIEGYPSEKFISLVLQIKPDQVTLVPDPPGALTSEQGWDTKKNFQYLKDIISLMHNSGIRTSIFINTDIEIIEYAAKTGTERVELYTEPYATLFYKNKKEAIASFVLAANKAHEIGLGLNAGHDLNLDNLDYFVKNVPHILEVSIGHALISDALYFGLEKTIKMYLEKLK